MMNDRRLNAKALGIVMTVLLSAGDCMTPRPDLARDGSVYLNILKHSRLRLYAVGVYDDQGTTAVSGTARTIHRGGPRPCGRVHAEICDPSGQVIAGSTGKLRLQTLSPRLGYRSRFEIRFAGRPPPGSMIRVWYGSQDTGPGSR